jgi:hypothetical protein
MVDGGAVRPESERRRGFRWPEAAVQARGAVGKGVALERGAGKEWVTEEQTGRGRVLSVSVGGAGGSGKREGEGAGVWPWECHVARGRSWGLAPTGGRRSDRFPVGRDPGAAHPGGASLFGQRCADADGQAPRGQ